MPDLATLMERCRRGDDLAWEAFVRQFEGRIYGMAVHYLRDREEAADVAQEIFIRIYRRLGSFRGGEDPLPWILRVARNLCLDQLRRIKARPPAQDVVIGNDVELAAAGATPEQIRQADSRKRVLYRALGAMSDKNREVILLKDIQGLKIEQIADLLHEPVGTIKSRSSRARIELATRVRKLDPSYGA